MREVTRAQALELAKERLKAGEELTPVLARIVLEELAWADQTRRELGGCTKRPGCWCLSCVPGPG